MYAAFADDFLPTGAGDLDGILLAAESTSRRQPGDTTVIAGLCMSPQEWAALDHGARLQLLQVLVETALPHQDHEGYYESYELALNLP